MFEVQKLSQIKIPLDWPNIGSLEKEYVLKALDSGFVSTAGPLVKEFEDEFAAFLGCRNAVSVVNGTCGLHLALRLLNIGPGDEVIVPALTFIASINPIAYAGATPVVVDVSADTWTIDPLQIEKAITSKTRAIIPVHLYGNPSDMAAIIDIARRHNLYIIEDATESLGATYQGEYTGNLGDIGVFSFNGNKLITTGGGGMLVSANDELAQKARLLVNQGRQAGQREYIHTEIGYNYRLTNIQAALGLAQMKRLPEFLTTKRANTEIYMEMLDGVPGISWQQELPGAKSSWWFFSIIVDEGFKEKKQFLISRLTSKGIQVRPFFKPLNQQPCYVKYNFMKCPVAEDLYYRGINLPSASFLTTDDVHEVCRELLKR
jgi:perosamine synthetase